MTQFLYRTSVLPVVFTPIGCESTYRDMMESSIEPVLAARKDNVLYLKHNLNARAIDSLCGEPDSVDYDVNTPIRNMQSAINKSDQFDAELLGG